MDDGLQIITNETSREDLLRHIAALERRLECDRYFTIDPDADEAEPDPFVEVILNAAERVDWIRSGIDGIGARTLTIDLIEERHLDPEGVPLQRSSATLLQELIEAAKGVGYADGFRAARDSLASSRAMVGGSEIELPKAQLVDILDISLSRFGPEVAEKGAFLERVGAAVTRALSRPARGGRP